MQREESNKIYFQMQINLWSITNLNEWPMQNELQIQEKWQFLLIFKDDLLVLKVFNHCTIYITQ